MSHLRFSRAEYADVEIIRTKACIFTKKNMRSLLLLFVFVPVIAFAQLKTNSLTRSRMAGLVKAEPNQYRIINGETYVPLLALVNDSYSKSMLPEGVFEGSRAGNIISLYIRNDVFEAKTFIQGIVYAEWALPMSPTLEKAVHDARVDSVQIAWNLPQTYTGKDVLIGITDWGFDYTHPMFYDTALQHTRIEKAWDQWRNSGPAPTGFYYGTEFTGESELLTAQCDTFNVYEYATHGSHVAGIAGGSGAGTIYRGVAWEAGFLFTTFLVDGAAVLDAYNWMFQYSQSVSKRLVINQSWGLFYIGNLDGTSLLSQAIDALSDSGVVFVSSAGNNGDADFHLMYDASIHDTLKTQVKFDNYTYYPEMFGQCVSLWGTPSHSFQASIQVLNSSGTLLAESPFIWTDTLDTYLVDTLFAGADTVIYNVLADSANPLNSRPFMQWRIASRNTTNKIILKLLADSGIVHAWNVIELNNGVGNWGSDFAAPYTGYTAGDPYYGVGEPACAHSAIAVAAHNSEYYHPTNGSLLGGNIAYFSSYGPLMDGTIKPDISAPGYGVTSSISSFTTQYIAPTDVIASVVFGGRTYRFVKFSGTSMSSPMVTGIVALMLEADPSLTSEEIMTILKETSREDVRTGDLSETGDTRWGWGKADALRAIYRVLGVEGVPELLQEEKVLLYPNPASDLITILAVDGILLPQIELFSMDGRLLRTKTLNEENMFSVEDMPVGMYFVRFVLDGKPLSMRFLVNE